MVASQKCLKLCNAQIQTLCWVLDYQCSQGGNKKTGATSLWGKKWGNNYLLGLQCRKIPKKNQKQNNEALKQNSLNSHPQALSSNTSQTSQHLPKHRKSLRKRFLIIRNFLTGDCSTTLKQHFHYVQSKTKSSWCSSMHSLAAWNGVSTKTKVCFILRSFVRWTWIRNLIQETDLHSCEVVLSPHLYVSVGIMPNIQPVQKYWGELKAFLIMDQFINLF